MELYFPPFFAFSSYSFRVFGFFSTKKDSFTTIGFIIGYFLNFVKQKSRARVYFRVFIRALTRK